MTETGRVTRARVLRGAPAALGAGILQRLRGERHGERGTPAGGAGAAPSRAAPPPPSCSATTGPPPTGGRSSRPGWPAPTAFTPQIKTEAGDNADTQEKIIAQFAADQQGDLV